MSAEYKMLLISIACNALVAVVMWAEGRKAGARDAQRKANKAKTDTAQMLTNTYANGIRVGKRQMLDQLVSMGKIHEETAAALSEDI